VSEVDAQLMAAQPTLKQRAQMRSIMETNEVSFDSGYEDEDKVERRQFQCLFHMRTG
jgi:hypothetical protein